MTPADRWLNKLLAGSRVLVENVIAGVKRCRIVKDVFRNLKPGLSDRVMELACSLHNFRMASRHPVPTVNLLQLLSEPYCG